MDHKFKFSAFFWLSSKQNMAALVNEIVVRLRGPQQQTLQQALVARPRRAKRPKGVPKPALTPRQKLNRYVLGACKRGIGVFLGKILTRPDFKTTKEHCEALKNLDFRLKGLKEGHNCKKGSRLAQFLISGRLHSALCPVCGP